jgi:hypothetical protein
MQFCTEIPGCIVPLLGCYRHPWAARRSLFSSGPVVVNRAPFVETAGCTGSYRSVALRKTLLPICRNQRVLDYTVITLDGRSTALASCASRELAVGQYVSRKQCVFVNALLVPSAEVAGLSVVERIDHSHNGPHLASVPAHIFLQKH